MTPNNDQFAGEWKNTHIVFESFQWFVEGSTVLIGTEGKKYDISWRDPQLRLWRIIDLPWVDKDHLEHKLIDVCTVQNSCQRHVKVSRDNNILTVSLEIPDSLPGHPNDGPVGTFTAEAGSGEEAVDATRLEESIAV